MTDSELILLTGATSKPWPTPVPRAPLGPFPPPVTYDHVLPFTPPPPRTLDFYRGNFCGLQIPGAPLVPGGSSDVMMACLLDNYPREWQDRFLLQYAQDGYSHLQRSIGHSIFYGHPIEEHIELSQRAQGDYGLFCDEWFLGAEAFNAFRQDVTYWKPIMDPILDQLLGAGVVDHACVGWQLDQFNAPGNTLIAIIKYFAERLPPTCPLFTHWVNEALAWWKTGGEVWTDQYGSVNVVDRFTWWFVMQPYLTGGHHQGDTTMARTNPQLYQDKMKDTLDPFSGHLGKGNMGRSHRGGMPKDFALTVFECTAQDQFDGRCSELEGDTVGYILTCTTSFNGKGMAGFGNGARMPDGGML